MSTLPAICRLRRPDPLARSCTREALGTRYDRNPTSAIKLEANHTRLLSQACERQN